MVKFESTEYFNEMAIEDAGDELERAMALFPDWPENDFEALAILLEEVGETANALLETKHAHKSKKTLDDVYKEAIQSAAMALRFAAGIKAQIKD